ncbi:50S ribosomal protein L21 [bacterium]|nr:50S ribosomal protein L21 [bacterium]
MFAIIETGGKQYKVEEGTIIDVEKLEVEAQGSVTFDKVLLVQSGEKTQVGQPYVSGASVSATVLNHVKDDKKIVFKFKPKTGYKRKAGHRQPLTTIRVSAIKF